MNLPALPSNIQSPAFQLAAKDELSRVLFTPIVINFYNFPDGLYGALLRGGTGVGKTYIIAGLTRDNLTRLKNPECSVNPFRALYLVPGNVKIQIQRALNMYGLTPYVHVMSYGELRGKNSPYILYETKSYINKEGKQDITLIPFWNPRMLPSLVVMDECQVGCNEGTLTSRILCSLPTHTMGVKCLLASATAFGRISESRLFMIVCGVVTPFNRLPLTGELFPQVAHSLCAQGKDPWDHSPKNMENLTNATSQWTVEVKNARFKCKAVTNLIALEFRTDEQRKQYNLVYEAYKARMRALNNDKGYFETGLIVEKWVALLKFRQAAELLRVWELTNGAVEKIKAGKQCIISSNYVDTLRGCWKTAVGEFKIPKERIGFIVGGQNARDRQRIVDDWQNGKLDLLLLMMKAGGVALSLHHDNEISRPRAIILPPTYAAKEFVQVVGRVLRFTSITDVEQDVYWFNNTVESEKVLPRVAIKLKCLDKAITAKEQWGHMFESFVAEEDREVVDEDKLSEEYGSKYKEENNFEVAEDGGYKTEEGELEMIGAEGLTNI